MLTVVQNDPEVPLGTYGQWLDDAGVPFTLLRPFTGEDLPVLDDVSAVIVLGGAMGVYDDELHPFLASVKRFIGETVGAGIPFLGICLGGQLLADAMGAPVTIRSPFRERGTLMVSLTDQGAADPLFAGIEREFISFQWHNDSFAVPTGAELLACSTACPNQCFRVGPHAYGTQFHPEVDREIVDRWVQWSPKTASAAEQFLSEFDRSLPHYRQASRQLLFNFLRIARLR